MWYIIKIFALSLQSTQLLQPKSQKYCRTVSCKQHCARSLLKKRVTDGGQRKKSPSSYNTSDSIVNATYISFEATIPKTALQHHLKVRAHSKKTQKKTGARNGLPMEEHQKYFFQTAFHHHFQARNAKMLPAFQFDNVNHKMAQCQAGLSEFL